MAETFKRVGHFKDVVSFRAYLAQIGVNLPMDDRILSRDGGSPMCQPFHIRNSPTGIDFTIGNRWCIHPMEGWDGTTDGQPTDHTIRRWQRFGLSGAKLLWGGEAFAVQPDGRANPNQLYYRDENVEPMRRLLNACLDAHRQRFGAGATDDLFVGLQLTHSGRFCKPNDNKKWESRIAYHHPLLDKKFGIDPNDNACVFTDDQIKRLIDNYVRAAKMAAALGFHFVDVKACHGYLGHEFLSAFTRPGPYGGDFRGRTRFMRETIQAIRAACPRLMIGVRVSIFDMPPHKPDPARGAGEKLGPGIPEDFGAIKDYPGFGCKRDNPLELDLAEPIQLLQMLRDELKVEMVNISAGSPYYVPHIQRPAFFPPSDGYQPPEDPIIGCARQIDVVRQLKAAAPGIPLVGTAYTYFQEYLPHIAQAAVRDGWVDFVGLGRMVLAYPDLPADCDEHGELRQAKLLCRTFSDCTTAPRNGIISGCYPLDDYYKDAPDADRLKDAKKALRERLKTLNAGAK